MIAGIACLPSVLVQKILIRDGIDDEVRGDLDGPVRATKQLRCMNTNFTECGFFPVGYLQLV